VVFKKKILCYVLVYDQVDIIRRSLDFITSYSDKLDIVVIENPSENSAIIKSMVQEYGVNSKIKRYYLFDENITGNAYDEVLTKELAEINSYKYVIITDGDLIPEKGQWLKEELSIMKHSDVFACGVSLSRANLPLTAFPDAESWIPPDLREEKDYFEAYTGGHLLMFRGKQFATFMKWKNKRDLNFVDGIMHDYCYKELGMKWTRTKHATALHLTWDLYADKDHPYTKRKLDVSFRDMWYHKRTTNFTLKTYK
jgi:5'(3')-deoxyribonucleotidase